MNKQFERLFSRIMIGLGVFLVAFVIIGMWANAVHKFGPRCVGAFQFTIGITAFLMLIGFFVWMIED